MLVASKKCFDSVMVCNNDNCKSESTPLLTYVWETYQVFVIHNCYTSKVKLLSSELKVFPEASDSCLVNDLFCTVDKYHFIWSKEEIVTCPFYLIGTDVFESMANFLFSKLLLFQTMESIVACTNRSFISTTEGLYLLRFNDKSELGGSRVNNENTNQANSLIVSDLDRKSFLLLNMIESISNSFNKKSKKVIFFRFNARQVFVVKNSPIVHFMNAVNIK